MEAIRIEGLSKNFGGLQVLKDLSLTVEAGEYVALIGPNGAGKTTLMNVLTGELTADSGHVYLFGKDIVRIPTYRRLKLGLARSFQITRLFKSLTVFVNVSLALQGNRPSRYNMFRSANTFGAVTKKAQDLLESIGLWEKRSELLEELSYGEQRKMEFVLSLASEPKILLMDEPAAGLDIAEIPDFISTIKNITKGTTLLFAAHDMDVVFDLAKRIVVLYFGKFIADGTPEEIQANQLVQEIYLGTKDNTCDAGIN
ncbi:ABC transporter ATP-binding protein [Chloroflexota bacterium]